MVCKNDSSFDLFLVGSTLQGDQCVQFRNLSESGKLGIVCRNSTFLWKNENTNLNVYYIIEYIR